MRHLTPADYRIMRWANGRGETVEVLRHDGPDGAMLLRLSMATVAADGPFSIFPGVDRNLTVIDGPGFDLVGGESLRAGLLVPVAFAGDIALSAAGVTSPSVDFNVMTARILPHPQVRVGTDCTVAPTSGTTCLFALGVGQANGLVMGRYDLWITGDVVRLLGGPFVIVQIEGVQVFGKDF